MNPIALIAKPATLGAIAATVFAIDLARVGGIAVAAVGVAVAATVGFFSVRNQRRSYWRNLVDERDAEIVEMKLAEDEKAQERAAFAEQQHDLRHSLNNELSDAKKQLELERAKSDLSTVFTRIQSLENTLKAREPLFQDILAGIDKQSDLLTQMLAQLTKNGGS